MNAILAVSALLLATQQPVAPEPSHLRTRWAAAVDSTHPLPEYPRPQMARPRWVNLNGPWDYAVQDSGAPRPGRFDGKILVPFPIESQLSGVRRAVTDRQRLWYRRTFHLPGMPGGTRWLLHFGAVDWEATVYLNARAVTTHRGGYDPFTVDVTEQLRSGDAEQELVVRVWDPSDHGEQPRGKQVSRPESIWYTAVTGIWQTVWLEPVAPDHITALDVRPDVDAATVTIRVDAAGPTPAPGVTVAAVDGDRQVATASGVVGQPLTLHIPDANLWGPGHPFLYGLRVRLASLGEDSVASYFGLRKIAVARDSAGVLRLFLNNRPLFQLGTLDQGWWPDGLYTAPTDEALRSDIETLQRLGFNLIRKHVKVEPARWYYDCDRLGMLVWQDMPSGDNKTAAAQQEFAAELRRVVDALRNHPAIVMWVPFNEGWGQHDTGRLVAWLKRYDPTRLVDNASGWTDAQVGDVLDVHDYPGPKIPLPDSTRARVLGEFGGLGLPLDGHTWQAKDNWGYRRYTDTTALWAAYRDLLERLRVLESEGLAAAVYTQTSDVEIEVNGLMTYDRAVVKLPAAAGAVNARLYESDRGGGRRRDPTSKERP
jgi:beta-galactosidase/beta-glucuronidase